MIQAEPARVDRVDRLDHVDRIGRADAADRADELIAQLTEENARLRQRIQDVQVRTAGSLVHATRLAQVISVLGQQAGLEQTLRRAASEVAELFSADIGLLLLGPDDDLQLEGHWGVDPSEFESPGLELPPAAAELQVRGPVVSGPADDALVPGWLLPYEPRHLVWARLISRDTSFGFMVLARRADLPFVRTDSVELQAIAYRIGLAVENGLLHRATERQLSQLRRLHAATTELTGKIELDDVAASVTAVLAREVGVESAALYTMTHGVLGLLAASGNAVLPPLLRPDDVASKLLVDDGWALLPLHDGERPLGAVALHPSPPEEGDEAELLSHLLRLAAIVVDKALLFDQSRRQALHDVLTGLPNRALLVDRLGQALAHQRPGKDVAVVFLDLDRFKVINDSLGHDAGDRLLIGVAERLEAVVRNGDTVARFGGDEFVIVCEDLADEDEAKAVAQRIHRAFERPFHVGTTEVVITTSQGVALADNAAVDPEALIRDADTALYRAKERGRDHFVIFGDELREESVDRLRVEADLRRAVEDGRLRCYYQPILDLRTGEIISAEALLRYQNEAGELVPPADFLEIAEESGLIVPIGTWVLEEACRQAQRWSTEFPDRPPLRVAVNLSARQIARPAMVDELAAVLQANGMGASIDFELTENTLLRTTSSTLEALEQLKVTGARVGIDDFGTGYSSLTDLKRFPADFLKIDRSFVAGLSRRRDDLAIVRAVVSLARTLDIECVAEGVEREEELTVLRDINCGFAQGFLFSRPVPIDDFDALVRGWTPPWNDSASPGLG